MPLIFNLFLILCIFNDFATGLIVTYDDVKELNATCYPDDNCIVPRISDSPGISWSSSCSCDRSCSRYNTCCMDSYYNGIAPPNLQPTCTSVKLPYADAAYFMVDRCSYDGSGDSSWEALCNSKWNGENDVMKLVPVTSQLTSVTYKNYFCFRCHETTDDFYYWNIWLKSNATPNVQPEAKDDLQLTYGSDNQEWLLTFANSNEPIEVDLRFDIPFQIWSVPIECEANVISNCNGTWTDDSVRDKCHAYTAIIYMEKDGTVLKYRNPHCALCNFESLDKMVCKSQFGETTTGSPEEDVALSSPGPGVAQEDKVPFSFTHLLDINRNDGDRVGKIQKCDGDFLWDPFGRKCRNLTCALPGFVVREGKCVPR